MLCFLQVSLVHGQFLDIDAAKNITNCEGDDLFPAWSDDGSSLIYQTNKHGNWDIFQYYLDEDTIVSMVISPSNERHPVFYNMGKSIVFDSDVSGEERIYEMNTITKNISLLFDRNIRSRQANFSRTEKLVFFSGYDPLKQRWEIYSFQFYYENLNKLTSLADENHYAVVSPDEDHVMFVNRNTNFPFDYLYMMNWYGEDEEQLFDWHITDPSWDYTGLKIYFISKKDNRTGDLYSVWIDGSHLYRLTDNSYELRNPQVSPDGKYMAIAVKLETGFDIFIVPFEDY